MSVFDIPGGSVQGLTVQRISHDQPRVSSDIGRARTIRGEDLIMVLLHQVSIFRCKCCELRHSDTERLTSGWIGINSAFDWGEGLADSAGAAARFERPGADGATKLSGCQPMMLSARVTNVQASRSKEVAMPKAPKMLPASYIVFRMARSRGLDARYSESRS